MKVGAFEFFFGCPDMARHTYPPKTPINLIISPNWCLIFLIGCWGQTVAITKEFFDVDDLQDGDLLLVLVKKQPADPSKGYVPAYKFEMRVDGKRAGDIELRLGVCRPRSIVTKLARS